jgi:hypothetical protein
MEIFIVSDSNVFQREKQPFRMLGQEFQYEFLPSIHFQEILSGVGQMLTMLSFEDETPTLKSDLLLPQAMDVARGVLEGRLYQVIADVLQYQNGHKVSVTDLKTGTRPLEIAQFLELLINDPEIHEAFAALGKSLTGLMTRLTGLSPTEKSTPSLPTTSDSNESTSTAE